MLRIPTRHLILGNGLLWSAIGIKIAITGLSAYLNLPVIHWWKAIR